MLPQVNDGRCLLAALIHHETYSTHKNNLAEKGAEANLNLANSLILKDRRAGIFVVKKIKNDQSSVGAKSYGKMNMSPRRGWGIFGLGFYKDVAPTALGKYITFRKLMAN